MAWPGGTSQAARTREERRGEQQRRAPWRVQASRGPEDENARGGQAEQEHRGNTAANRDNSPVAGMVGKADNRNDLGTPVGNR